MALQGGDIIPLNTLKGEIEFNDVDFSYPSRPQHVSMQFLFCRISKKPRMLFKAL